jgi:hypothetical protein
LGVYTLSLVPPEAGWRPSGTPWLGLLAQQAVSISWKALGRDISEFKIKMCFWKKMPKTRKSGKFLSTNNSLRIPGPQVDKNTHLYNNLHQPKQEIFRRPQYVNKLLISRSLGRISRRSR